MTAKNNITTDAAFKTAFQDEIGITGLKSNPELVKINRANKTALEFNSFKSALVAGTINVTIWGDSLSTQNPNALTSTDSYYMHLREYLQDKYPNKTFVFNNVAIGGTLMSEWNDDKTINTITKPWIDHVADTSCDLLLIGFGMNHSNYTSAKAVKFYLKSILDHISANFAKQPDIAVLTTPLPAQEGGYSAEASQNSRNLAAYGVRMYGQDSGCYVIDVNRIFNIKRNKIDQNTFFTKSVAVNDSEIQSIINGNYTKSGVEYILQSNAEYIDFDVNVANFKLDFYAKFESFPVGSEHLAFNFCSPDVGRNIFQILPNLGAGVVYYDSYFNAPDSGNLGAVYTNRVVGSASYSDGIYRHYLIQKVDDNFQVLVNSAPTVRTKVQINNLKGGLRLQKLAGSIGIVTIKDLKIYNLDEREFIGALSDEQIWGNYAEGSAETQEPFGGNGINHPSSIGLQEIYLPCIREFVNDLPLE